MSAPDRNYELQKNHDNFFQVSCIWLCNVKFVDRRKSEFFFIYNIYFVPILPPGSAAALPPPQLRRCLGVSIVID
jgi:hypothetical protein